MVKKTLVLNSTTATVNGSASHQPGDEVEFQSGSLASGSAFFNEEINLTGDFTFSTTFEKSPGDGFTFVLHNDSRGVAAKGSPGHNLGAGNNPGFGGGIENGIAITFDTHQNTGDASGNSTSIIDTDDDFRTASRIESSNDVTSVDFDDGLPHTLTVDWDASTRTMEWSVDGVQIGSRVFTETELDTYLTSDRTVYAGLASTSGGADTTQFSGTSLYAAYVCFCAGTLVETQEGNVPVELLKPGDLVQTVDRGYQPILWVGKSRQVQKNAVVKIETDALGAGLPKRDLRLSRQHRVLIRSPIAERMFGNCEVLVPAVRLVGLPGIVFEDGSEYSDLYHFLLPNHEIVFAEGAGAESLFPGPEALKMVSSRARRELNEIVDHLADCAAAKKTSRLVPSRKKQKSLVARHLKNGRPLVDSSFNEFALVRYWPNLGGECSDAWKPTFGKKRFDTMGSGPSRRWSSY